LPTTSSCSTSRHRTAACGESTRNSETWPPFFEWQRQGASFEIVELDVTASDDVAFAWALLRCGTADELKRDPANRLRLTIGLRNEGGRWVVTHEHHSFAAKD
jgi:ketosteroid isomerase-like protein